MFDIGSCSLHIVYGAFKSAFNSLSWDREMILKVMYHDSPAHRGAYICESFPVCWLENDEFGECAIEVWDNVVTPFKWFKQQPASKQPRNIFQNEVLSSKCELKHIVVQLSFFKDIATNLHIL